MSENTSHPTRIVIIGAGHVGATLAYALLWSGLAAEIVLLDANAARAEGEAMDLNHAMPFTRPVRIWAAREKDGYADCAGAAITVLCAGASQKPGETRLDLVKRNADIFREIVPKVAQHNPHGILLIATNPVDVLTYVAWKWSGLPPGRVIGSGTVLDTARFRYLLSQHFGVDPRSVHAHIIGEHGDSEVPVWSLANVAGMRLPEYCAARGMPYDQPAMQEIFKSTRDAAYRIIERKGATCYAVAAGLMRIIEAIVRNQNTVLPVSSLVNDYYGISDICLSLPAVVNRGGIERIIPLTLDETEIAGIRHSADVLRQTLATL
jgi:L-lactate dehydrogenase